MEQGNVIEQCSEPGPSFGKFSGTEECPISGIIPVINRLFRDGKIRYKTFNSFGLRWERYYSVNVNGETND
jgi:hypothetical protein